MLMVITICESCRHNKPVVKKSDNYRSVDLKKDDSIFLTLMDTAQAHLPAFINYLREHGRDTAIYRFAIKSDYYENDNHEHMWARINSYQNGIFKGVFIDSPFVLKNIKRGDYISIKKDSVEDWSIYNTATHKSIGEFSDKYLKSKIKDSTTQ